MLYVTLNVLLVAVENKDVLAFQEKKTNNMFFMTHLFVRNKCIISKQVLKNDI